MLPVYNFEHLEDNINDDLMEFSISNQLVWKCYLWK